MWMIKPGAVTFRCRHCDAIIVVESIDELGHESLVAWWVDCMNCSRRIDIVAGSLPPEWEQRLNDVWHRSHPEQSAS